MNGLERKNFQKAIKAGEKMTKDLLKEDVHEGLMTLTACVGAYFYAITLGNSTLANDGVQELADAACEMIAEYKKHKAA